MERLQEYKKRLIVFPRRSGKTKTGDASAEDVKAAKKGDNVAATSAAFPIVQAVAVAEGKLSDYKGEENAFRKLRDVRSEARLVGVRAKRAQAKAEEESAKKK